MASNSFLEKAQFHIVLILKNFPALINTLYILSKPDVIASSQSIGPMWLSPKAQASKLFGTAHVMFRCGQIKSEINILFVVC